MGQKKMIGKREFIQHTSKYLKWVEQGEELIISHQNKPALIISKIKPIPFKKLRGLVTVTVHGDINEHVLPGYDTW